MALDASSVPRIAESAAMTRRMLTLVVRRLRRQLVGDATQGSHWKDPVTQQPLLDWIEIWNLINLTEDAHRVHLHLVPFQILHRRPFDEFAYQRNPTLRYVGPAANEAGWGAPFAPIPEWSHVDHRSIRGFHWPLGLALSPARTRDNEMMPAYQVVAA